MAKQSELNNLARALDTAKQNESACERAWLNAGTEGRRASALTVYRNAQKVTQAIARRYGEVAAT